jgi:predicted permease
MLRDLIQAWRSLRRSKEYALAAILTLALGLGANAAIFTAVLGAVLRPLPLPASERLMWVGHAHRESGVVAAFSPQDFDDLARATNGRVFSDIADYAFFPRLSGMNLTGTGTPLRVPVANVSGAWFRTLGAAAELGRALQPDDDRVGGDHVVVLSHALWRSRFAHDRAIVGRKVVLDGEPFVIAGVMPAAFTLPDRQVGLWAPLSLMGDSKVPHLREVRWLSVVGRLAPGVTQQAAAAHVGTVLASLERQFPDSNKGWGRVALRPLHDVIVGDVRPLFTVLATAAGAVLLIVCVNLANLTLARATGRSREMAIRAAVGATPMRLTRQLMAESLALALAGGALGLLLAHWGLAALRESAADFVPRAGEMRLDGIVAVFTLALALAAGIGFGLAPALSAAASSLREALQQFGSAAGAAGTWRRRSARSLGGSGLVVLETALATVLLLGASLLLRSFWQLLHVEPGFDSASVLSLSISVPERALNPTDNGMRYVDAILDRLRALPGVLAAGASHTLPLAGGADTYRFTTEGDASPREVMPAGGVLTATSGYFRALGIPLVAGRDFDRRDDDGKAPPAIIVNQALARQLWPGQSPLGRRLRAGELGVQIVGVVADVHNDGLAKPVAPTVYGPPFLFTRSTLKLFVRTVGSPLATLGAARRAIWDVDHDLPIAEEVTMQDVVDSSLALPRLLSWLVGAFGGLAALLAALGTYGVIAYGVRRRTREIGVRMALGADRTGVIGLVVRQGLGLCLCGLACGLLAGLAGAPLLGSLLFQVKPFDPVAFAAAALVVVASALAASYIPAREAASVDPLLAIRSE